MLRLQDQPMSPSTPYDSNQRSKEVGPRLDKMPAEILEAILASVPEGEVKYLRDLSKDFNAYLTPRTFFSVKFAQEETVLDRFQNIATSPHLSKHIKSITLIDTERGSDRGFVPASLSINPNPHHDDRIVSILRRGLAFMDEIDTICFSVTGIWRAARNSDEELLPPSKRGDPSTQARQNMLVALARAVDGLPNRKLAIVNLHTEDLIPWFSYDLMEEDLKKVHKLFSRLQVLHLPLHMPTEELRCMIEPERSGERLIGDTIRDLIQRAPELRELVFRLPALPLNFFMERPQPPGNLLNRFIGNAKMAHITFVELADIPVYEADLCAFVTNHAQTLLRLSLDCVDLLRGSYWMFLRHTLNTGTRLEDLQVWDCRDYTDPGDGQYAMTSWDGKISLTSEGQRCIDGHYGSSEDIDGIPFTIHLEEDIAE
ncbi:MAG: hypothetical protein M1822_002727 [Bathelium mastoideum]|nr:MAG: hypothetical protein M1822_002727 [Bathelium mastoideum]